MSRLDRLVLLLENGTAVVRNTAAEQLAQVQKAHPHELYNLLGRVVPYLKSANWDTRIVASKALGGIIENVPIWRPVDDSQAVQTIDSKSQDAELTTTRDDEMPSDRTEECLDLIKLKESVKPDTGNICEKSLHELKPEVHVNGCDAADTTKFPSDLAINDSRLSLATFDILAVIQNGKTLLGSAGKEYDFSHMDMSTEERLARAKHNISARLGLGGEYIEEDFVLASDVGTQTASNTLTDYPNIRPSTTDMALPVDTPHISIPSSPKDPASISGEEELSARQKNMLKRKAKQSGKGGNTKVRVVDVSTSLATRKASQGQELHPSSTSIVPPEAPNDGFSVTPQSQNDKVVVEHKPPTVSPSAALKRLAEDRLWPFEGLMELLVVDLFDSQWEIRHGAAMAMREVVKVHGTGAGRIAGKSLLENEELNRKYLDDLVCRLCCIFALDRFGDYISDQVVAPIRESVSQTLAALLKILPLSSVLQTYKLLQLLVFQSDSSNRAWEVTHGGMLGLKYLVAVRKDILLVHSDLFDGVVSSVLYGLADHDDDVRSVSAATLIPMVLDFVQSRPHMVGQLLDVLWECLANLKDDLSASTGSVMDLLAQLCSIPTVLDVMTDKSDEVEHSFVLLIPRLYPFLRHAITSVRQAVLRALLTFVHVQNDSEKSWIDGRLLRLIFQNMLVEQTKDVLDLTLDFWNTCMEFLGRASHTSVEVLLSGQIQSYVLLVMTPIGTPRNPVSLDSDLFIKPSGRLASLRKLSVSKQSIQPRDKSTSRGRPRNTNETAADSKFTHNIDGPMIDGDLDLIGFDVIIRARIVAAMAIGVLMSVWPANTVEASVWRLISPHTVSSHSTPRLVAAIIAQQYFCKTTQSLPLLAHLRQHYDTLLSSGLPRSYSNLTSYLRILRGQCQALCNAFLDLGHVSTAKIPQLPIIVQGYADAGLTAFSFEVAEKLVGEDFDRLFRSIPSTQRVAVTKALKDAKDSVTIALSSARSAKAIEDVRINAAVGRAIVSMGDLPKKLNPIIKSLMDSIKKESNQLLQNMSASALADFVQLCSASGKWPAIDKLIKNLCAFLCVDTSETPEFHRNIKLADQIYSLKKEEDRFDVQDITGERTAEIREARNKHAGAQMALEAMAEKFGPVLFDRIPKLHQCIFAALPGLSTANAVVEMSNLTSTFGQEVIDGLCILRTLVHKFDESLQTQVLGAMPMILEALRCQYSTIRHAAAKCIAAICLMKTTEAMHVVIVEILPMLADAYNVHHRQGAVEAVHYLVVTLETNILPYVIFLIVPILGRMSDPNDDIRTMATTTFAMLVKLVPLESGIPDPPGLSPELLLGRERERKFISQMLDVNKIEPFPIPVAINAVLRSYQQEGVNWLAFLNEYQLHGILCDDMGLGKTLQSICIVASDHHNRAQIYSKTKASQSRPLPSLVVCPPTLCGHWQQELQTYAPFINAVCYVGFPPERSKLKPQLAKADIVITSYDICRNDIEELGRHSWNYCVLDEGHVIKNSKAKLTKAVKLIKASHRLILSGTPIQNNVLELWSMFDFLMPGFLGSEKSFHERYSRPIASSRDSKSSLKDQEAGALALEALHKQVLPFLLRRLKEDVLADLPPKIIQDYYCELSPLQKKLYDDFTLSQSSRVKVESQQESIGAGKSHVFQALQYMRKLCNHPALVLNEKHPKYNQFMKELAITKTRVRDISHAPKLLALKDLLLDCGIGSPIGSSLGGDLSGVVNEHRALIFCQLKDMLDMVENDVLKQLLPSVSYLRLDGSIDARHRQGIVQKFNADPSIDVLLLTTHVGGLGLNLTGADTVIFVEHDWNPMKDLQAMDRAHRIGQKKVVNVYRLITRGTLEEKIMGLQKFKMNIASTVVNQQNSGLATMQTDQILDLFSVKNEQSAIEGDTSNSGVDSQGNISKKGVKNVLADIGELWDASQYHEEYNLDSFVKSLG